MTFHTKTKHKYKASGILPEGSVQVCGAKEGSVESKGTPQILPALISCQSQPKTVLQNKKRLSKDNVYNDALMVLGKTTKVL